MKVLLDTCAFLWMLNGDPSLSVRAREIITDSDVDLFLSAASSWEIAIKAALGKITLKDDPELLVPAHMSRNGILPVPISHAHALRTIRLPLHHTDPFDRILIAQADVEGLVVLSPDRAFAPYRVRTVW